MYKSKLQELCQSKKWKLPEYKVIRQGVPKSHCPLFGATVIVNSSHFASPHLSRSIKDAQNLVAQIAFHTLTGKPQILNTSIDAKQPDSNEPVQSSSSTGVESPPIDDKRVKDMAHLYKTQLQIYAQKRNLKLPVYVSEREGPPHATRYKSKVTLDGKIYESSEFFSTIKDAENSAAKTALTSLSSDQTEEENPGFFKNLLQELAQREYYCLPSYTAARSGPSHKPVFVSTVKIRDLFFTGQGAKTKKLAEMYAAKVAYNSLRERTCDSSSKLLLPITEFQEMQISSPNPEPNRVKVEQVQSNEGVHHQSNEAKLSEVSQTKVDLLPFRRDDSSNSPKKGVSKVPPSSSRAPPPPHTKVKFIPVTPKMPFQAGVKIMRRDDKRFAVTRDSTHGN